MLFVTQITNKMSVALHYFLTHAFEIKYSTIIKKVLIILH
jgi:hypothetical protein